MTGRVGRTVLLGHGLRYEGRVIFNAKGVIESWPSPTETIHAKCSCGALSPPGISQNAAKRWHREHKDSLR